MVWEAFWNGREISQGVREHLKFSDPNLLRNYSPRHSQYHMVLSCPEIYQLAEWWRCGKLVLS